MFGKRKVATLVAEFLGTGILTLLVLSVQRSTIGVPFFVATIAGVTLVAMVLAFGDISGAYLNPAVTLGLWTARKLSTLRAVVLIVMEFLGAWVGYYAYTYFVNSKLTNVGGHFSGRTLAAEAVGTGILAVVWAAASFKKWPKTVTAPAVGLALLISMVAASTAGLGLVNPALALGVRAWVWGTYVLGPVIGAVVGINLYGLLMADGGLNFSLKKAAIVKPTSSSSKKPARKSRPSSRAKR